MELTLQQAFESTFHTKYDFVDFLSSDSSMSSKIVSSSKTSSVFYQPEPNLKAYLKFLNRFVFSHLLIQNDVVFSYRKDHSVLQAILQHQHNGCFFKTDLKDFFNSITEDQVRRVIQTKLHESPIYDLNAYHPFLEQLVMIDGKLPVGFPTSPAISNSVLYEMDVFLADWAKSNQVVYTRYADDLIFSAQTDEVLKQLPQLLEELLENLYGGSLQLNPEKTFFTHSGKKLKLLGLVLLPNGHVTISKTVKTKIETLLHYYSVDKKVFSEMLERDFGDVSKLMGTLHYAQTIDKGYINKLRRKYGNFLLDIFLKGKMQP